MRQQGCSMALATAIGALAATGAAVGGEVTGGSSGLVSLSNAGSMNNDNLVVQSANVIVNSYTLSSLQSFDIVYSVEPTGGVTEYHVSSTVTNGYVHAMEGITFQLGVGTGESFVALSDASALAALDFDAPGYDPTMYSEIFTSFMTSPFKLAAKGGLIGAGATSQFGFSIDVPDGVGGSAFEFTLRTTPTFVPAPGPLALVVAATCAARSRRRQPLP